MLNRCLIYKLTSKTSGKSYIGQTWTSTAQRANYNGSGYKGCQHLWHAIQSYGWDDFNYEVLGSCSDQTTADYLEQSFIRDYNAINNGYNILIGGQKNTFLGQNHTQETRQKISMKVKEAWKSGKFNDEVFAKRSTSMKGKNVGAKTVEHRAKLSAAKKGRGFVKKCILSFEQAQEIKQLYSTGNYYMKELAKLYNVSTTTVCNIISDNIISFRSQ